MSEGNKGIVGRYFEAVNQHNLDALDEIFAADYIDHAAPPDQPPGPEGLKRFFAVMESGFPDFHVTLEDIIAEGDSVAARFTFHGTHQGEFMEIPPTGKQVTMSGIDIMRIKDSRIAELWGHEDMLGMLQQLGVAPTPGQSE